jgi:hypothetical protein
VICNYFGWPFLKTLGGGIKFLYEDLNSDDLRGYTVADLLVNVEADFQIVHLGRIIYSELAFPVAGLAREFAIWLNGARERGFDFASLSFDESGAVAIHRVGDGWSVGSIFEPDKEISPLPWSEVRLAIDEFINRVRSDAEVLGLDNSFIARPVAE